MASESARFSFTFFLARGTFLPDPARPHFGSLPPVKLPGPHTGPRTVLSDKSAEALGLRACRCRMRSSVLLYTIQYNSPSPTPPQGQTPGVSAGLERRRKTQNHMFYSYFGVHQFQKPIYFPTFWNVGMTISLLSGMSD